MSSVRRSLRKRLACLLLAGAVLLGLVPAVGLGGTAEAAYADSYVQQMVDWGFMRGDIDGNLRPNDPITRAEFVTIVNRSFGYEAMGGHPFTDVNVRDWYNDDVDIAYTEGYINGTSETTFSPAESITREEAAVILTRNMMLQPTVGEDTSFSDSRELDEWSRGYVATAARYQLLTGYTDGSFRPKNPITRGEAAILLTRAVGTPVQEAGVHELGYTWGNVTITESGATLRNTVVGGNLYITAGVDLGSVTLENVRVLGEIVISGGGVSEGGDDSIVLRNVDAPTLIVDNLRNQQVSLRVEGSGVIDSASVRTDAFVTDNTQAGYGLSHIELAGEEEDMSLHLSGNVKEVVNKTPGSALSVDSGKVDTITVDETATDSTLEIASGAEVEHVNLDVAAEVTGAGDIANLTVNAPGSSVSMLPDQITIRPGVTADIAGETMDSTAAAESSADPRLLSGYPSVTDLAPTTATARFSANKRGTVHWAVTSVTDGSATVDELLNPPAYTNKIVQNGTLSLGGSEEVGTAALRGLTSDGSYYLAAVMVDARGEQSPMKVISFTTPDDSVPDFADGYPYLSQITNISAQVTVMATKTCRLYWAVLPEGAAAPTAEDFKANAVSGNLGFGTLDLTKNVEATFDANNVPLEELEDYVVYLWLTDVDGGQSSRVESLDFTTVDRTPPIFNTEATVNEVERNSVGLYANLNEDGTLYWVIVPQGEEYPKPLAGQSGEVDLASDTAKLQVANGMNCLDSGSVRMREGQDVDFRVTGLDPETAYDLYYVAQDEAGNYSDRVRWLTIHTLDPNAPTVTQEFTDYPGTDATQPYPDTDIRLVFSEAVQDSNANKTLVSYYTDVVNAGANAAAAREAMATALRNSIKLYQDTGNGRPTEVPEAPADAAAKAAADWVIDYRYAEIILEEGKTVVTFPTTDDSTSALNLASGATYYFEIQADTIADTSDAKNIMGRTQLEEFTTVFAIVNLSNPNEASLEGTVLDGTTEDAGDEVTFPPDDPDARLVDVSWLMIPNGTENVPDNVNWDMIIWSDTTVRFDLYSRELGGDGEQWSLIGKDILITVPPTANEVGVSLTRILRPGNNPQFDRLNTLSEDVEYEYAIHFTQVENLDNRDTWSQLINIGVTVLAGNISELNSLAFGALDDAALEEALNQGLMNIGIPEDFNLRRQFSDQRPPVFTDQHPYFEVGDSMVNMYFSLDRPGTVYYVIAPKGTFPASDGTNNFASGEADAPTVDNSGFDPENAYSSLPQRGEYVDDEFEYYYQLTNPTPLQIINADFTNSRIKYGSVSADQAESELLVEDLEVTQDYIAYFVIQGTSSQVYSDQVYAYRFTTSDVEPAYITLRALNPEVEFRTSQDANLYYALYAPSQLPDELNQLMVDDSTDIDHLKEGVDVEAFKKAYPNMTVLDAMCQTLDQAGKSVFDEYADDEIKETIRIILQSQTGGGSLDQGNFQAMEQGQPEENDFTDAMDPNSVTMYICLATAQNVLGGDWTFKAVNNVCIPDDEAPILVAYSSNGTINGGYVSGTFTVRFNEVLYYMPEGGDSNSVEPIVRDDHPVDNVKDLVGFLDICDLGTSTGWAEYTTQNESPTNTYTIRFQNFVAGDTISFPISGQLTDVRGNTNTNRQYMFQLRETEGIGLIQQGSGKYEFVLVSGEYEPDT